MAGTTWVGGWGAGTGGQVLLQRLVAQFTSCLPTLYTTPHNATQHRTTPHHHTTLHYTTQHHATPRHTTQHHTLPPTLPHHTLSTHPRSWSKPESDELLRRKLLLGYYLLRDPAFARHTLPALRRWGGVAARLPLAGWAAGRLVEIVEGAQQLYSYTAAS